MIFLYFNNKNVLICEVRNIMWFIIFVCDIKLFKNYKLVYVVKMNFRVIIFCLR